MNGYERLRESLRGTALDGAAEKVKAAYDLRDDDPAWTYVATVEVASAKLVNRLDEAQVEISQSLGDLPAAMRSSAVEIVRGLASEIAQDTVTQVCAAVADLRKQERAEDAKRIDALVREAEATQLVARNAVGQASSAIEDARTKITAHGDYVATMVRDLTARARLVGYAILGAVLIGFVGAGTAGALIEHRVDHNVTYEHGWQDGAAAVRAHLRR